MPDMLTKRRLMPAQKTIALVAHDSRKDELITWAHQHKNILSQHQLVATGTTGGQLSKALNLDIKAYLSGPLGGDLQLGAAVSEQNIDILIFFWDPLESQPHEPDIKALLRIATLWNIPFACNQATANLIIQSNRLNSQIEHEVIDYQAYMKTRENG